MTDEYLTPTRMQRIKILIWGVIAILFSLIIKFSIPAYISFISEKPFCAQVLWWRWSLGVVFLIGITCVYYSARFGYLLLIHNQLPLPGSNVFFRTKIVRGWRVKVEALIFFIFSIGIFVGLIYFSQTDFISDFYTTKCVGP